MKKVYFLLSACWGPVIRALPIANMLKEQGVKTYFHVSGKVAELVEKAGHEKVSPENFPQDGESTRDWWNLDQFLSCFGWSNADFVEKRFLSYVKAIQSVNPDVIIVDFNTSAMMAARCLNIPTLAITQSCFHPERKWPYIVWWKKPSTEIPSITANINTVMQKYGGQAVSRSEDLQVGTITVIPSFPEFDPLLKVDKSTYYVGPILGNEEITKGKDVREDFAGDNFIIVYPGRPKDAGGDSGSAILASVIPAVNELRMDTIVSLGGFNYPQFSNAQGNVFFTQWISLEQIRQKCKLIIHHGGHGTCLSALTLGVPSLIMPTFAEREYNARNIANLGAGICLPFESFSKEQAMSDISELLTNAAYAEKATRWKNEINRRHYGGASEVAKLINSLM
ncbi:hypothetical protein A2165_01540 [Candidatus Curtissbacteria bacterium RBG_13_40_7]|uniref:Erythromycin biosynthesis protein CIII-like C-terminal domain-containing protein n=1 Tax=Candidatus Curtissbacteria bacterium RBG_13_40_7 TaxID=1797706 RepID=A0A1F5FTR4_9BACT|nr:MAG: hypothetical protein A2165_01540 [Candidatus Curtissbacteria bacterium RBG_13_40_7]